MKFENNLSLLDALNRHIAGMLVAIISGFLGRYVAPVFYYLLPLAPYLIVTAIVGWSPIVAIKRAKRASENRSPARLLSSPV